MKRNLTHWDPPVDVVLPVGGKVIVDDQRYLLDINASSLWRNSTGQSSQRLQVHRSLHSYSATTRNVNC